MHFMTMARQLRTLTLMGLAFGTLAGCARDNQLDLSSGVGITTTRSLCPSVAIPVHTGDITVFNPPASREARAIDVVATITKVRPACNDTGEQIYSETAFDVLATRSDGRGSRTVQLPYFSTVVQGGTAVVAKQIGTISVTFADGQTRAQTTGNAKSWVAREAAQLPADIIERITRRRKAGDTDAAIDPLSVPEVRAAVARASFEHLIGFQLTSEQLQYNVTR
jgi:hypothetical protein